MKTIRQSVLIFLVALLISAGLGSALSTSVAAQSTVNVRSCFVYTNGYAAPNFTLKLYKWNGSAYVLYRTGTTASNGCGTFYNVPASQAYYFVASKTVKTWDYNRGCYVIKHWQGSTAKYQARATGTSDWGAWYVYFSNLGC